MEMRPALKIVGERRVTSHRDNHANHTVARLMNGFLFERAGEVMRRVNAPEFYGILDYSVEGLESDVFAWIAGVEADSLADLPEGMVGIEYPALLYAVLTYRGTAEGLGDVFSRFFNDWLPGSGYENAASFAFQHHGAGYLGPFHPESVIEFCFPVRPKSAEPDTIVVRDPDGNKHMLQGDGRSGLVRSERSESNALGGVPELVYDGCSLDVLWDNHDNAVRWFADRFGWQPVQAEKWKPDPLAKEGRMTHLGRGTWLVSALADRRLPHHYAERGTVQPNVRWCWRVRNAEKMHKELREDGVRVGELYKGRDGSLYFDLWATAEGIRLTVQEDGSVADGALEPSWTRIGVTNVTEAVSWYEKHVGMKLVEKREEQGWAMMELGLNRRPGERSLWMLEKLPPGTFAGRCDPQVRPYVFAPSREAFFAYHRYLRSQGIEVSGIGGFIERGLAAFHFYDPDGNRFNVSSL